ncbi:sn-glycerol-3-phosphate ABC transporter permease UgpE [Rhodobacteraceae bacterium]|nr:sn-glycerol-3-phosphate ABC transporter permease UgpE [Paracoccaceae bacterium]
MVENRPLLTFLSHLVLILGVISVALPVWLALVASTHPSSAFVSGRVPLWFGPDGLSSYIKMMDQGASTSGTPPIGQMMFNSLVMALIITVGKIVISMLSAFAICYFRFPFRVLAFWAIFITLMLPVEVRIVPTFEVVANLGMLNSYAGLSIPLIASATATFLFRQVFLTLPDELTEAARIDGAGPMKFFWDHALPLSRTNIAALAVILFIYGWNQYLWPLIVTTDESYYTIVMGIKRMASVVDDAPRWNDIMAVVVMAMMPPVLVVVAMQKLFVKGLVETEK